MMKHRDPGARAVSGLVSTPNRFETALIQGVRAFSDAKPVSTFAENALGASRDHSGEKGCLAVLRLATTSAAFGSPLTARAIDSFVAR